MWAADQGPFISAPPEGGKVSDRDPQVEGKGSSFRKPTCALPRKAREASGVLFSSLFGPQVTPDVSLTCYNGHGQKALHAWAKDDCDWLRLLPRSYFEITGNFLCNYKVRPV